MLRLPAPVDPTQRLLILLLLRGKVLLEKVLVLKLLPAQLIEFHRPLSNHLGALCRNSVALSRLARARVADRTALRTTAVIDRRALVVVIIEQQMLLLRGRKGGGGFGTACPQIIHHDDVETMRVVDAQLVLDTSDRVDGGRVVMFNHPACVARVFAQGLIDQFEGANVAQRAVVVDVLGHPFEELVGAAGFVVALIEAGRALVL